MSTRETLQEIEVSLVAYHRLAYLLAANGLPGADVLREDALNSIKLIRGLRPKEVQEFTCRIATSN